MLYVDIPSSADIATLAAHHADVCVSIYLQTTPVTQETTSDCIELKNLAKEAIRQLHARQEPRRDTPLSSPSNWTTSWTTTSSGGFRLMASRFPLRLRMCGHFECPMRSSLW